MHVTGLCAVPRHLYQLAEYPWPQRAPGAADSDFCSGEDVLAYLRSYVRHFGLERHIRCVWGDAVRWQQQQHAAAPGSTVHR
jgi:cation diffusion facilitator CzcD-associated flavoprotein CzcO